MIPEKYQQAVIIITKEQEKIIGKNLSMQLVQSVDHLRLGADGNPVIDTAANPVDVLGELVDQYATVFGRASIEVAKEAVKTLSQNFSASELPENLK